MPICTLAEATTRSLLCPQFGSVLNSPAVQTNDMMLAIYLSSVIRSVLALHQLIDNKERRLWREKQQQQNKENK